MHTMLLPALLLCLLAPCSLRAGPYRPDPHINAVIEEITGDPEGGGARIRVTGKPENTLGYGTLEAHCDWITGFGFFQGGIAGGMEFSELEVGDTVRVVFHPHVQSTGDSRRARAWMIWQYRDGMPAVPPVPTEPDLIGVIDQILIGTGIGHTPAGVLTVRVIKETGETLPGEIWVSVEQGRTEFFRYSGPDRYKTDLGGLRVGQEIHVRLEPGQDPAAGTMDAVRVTVLRPN